MFEQMKVYHKNQQYGTIVKFEKDTYFIDFDGKIKKVFVGNWLKTLFLTAEDSRNKIEEINLKPYKEILAIDERIYKATNIYRIRENMIASENRNIERAKLIPPTTNRDIYKVDSNKFWVENEFSNSNLYNEVKCVEKDSLYDETMQEETGYFDGYYPGHQDFELDDVVYDSYIKDPYDLESSSELYRKLDEMRHEVELISEAKKFILMVGMVDRNTARGVVLLSITPIEIGRHKFLNIIGIDVSTAKIITIVDQNGREYGFHSDNHNFSKLCGQTPLIKAKFELLEDAKRYNVLRIVSDFEIVDRFDTNTLNGLDKKYKIISQEEMRMTAEFKIAAKVPHIHDKNFYLLVNFKDTVIGRNRNSTKFCIKMGYEYPRIKDSNFISDDMVGRHFSGMVIISWNLNKNGKVIYFAERLFGKIINEDKLGKLGGNIMPQYSDEYEEFLGEYEDHDPQYGYDLEMNDGTEFYSYDEFSDQHVHCFDEEPCDYEEEREQCNRMDDAYWFSDDEYEEGKSNEKFLW